MQKKCCLCYIRQFITLAAHAVNGGAFRHCATLQTGRPGRASAHAYASRAEAPRAAAPRELRQAGAGERGEHGGVSGAEHAADLLPQLEAQVEAGPVVGGAWCWP